MEFLTFKNGIHVFALKSKWRNLLFILKKILTCEGRYGVLLFYHAILLMHFIGGKELTFPYYLMLSLNKMAFNIQRDSRNIYRALYHRGLVKNNCRGTIESQW